MRITVWRTMVINADEGVGAPAKMKVDREINAVGDVGAPANVGRYLFISRLMQTRASALQLIVDYATKESRCDP